MRGLTSSKRTPVMSSEDDESSSWLDAMRRRFERELSSDDDDEDEDEDEDEDNSASMCSSFELALSSSSSSVLRKSARTPWLT